MQVQAAAACLGAVLSLGWLGCAAPAPPPSPPPPLENRNLYLVSDSTAQSLNPDTSPIQGYCPFLPLPSFPLPRPRPRPSSFTGYEYTTNSNTHRFGFFLGSYFTLNFTNLSRGGRSTRSYINEGLWSTLLSTLPPSTFVVLQFGINDNANGNPPSSGTDLGKDRATLPGTGDETLTVVNSTGQVEVVRTFGSYLRQMVRDVRAKRTVPIVAGMDPLMIWMGRGNETLKRDWPWADYAKEVATRERVEWLDHTRYSVDRWQALGRERALEFFPLNDSTHTNAAGAKSRLSLPLCGFIRWAGGGLWWWWWW